jgi:prepilin-type N-terminal cleavage/methylation domain-containing protein
MKTMPTSPVLRAFTLVELLVVVTIVALLASLTASALSRGKAASQRIACINKLRQWGNATQFYAEDHNDKLPKESVFDGINTWEMTTFTVCAEVWYNSLPKALGVTSAATYSQTPTSQRSFYARNNFFHCPSARFAPVSATYPNFSLAINSKLMMDFESAPGSMLEMVDLGGPSELRTSEIVLPEKTALFLDAGVAGEQRLSEYQPPYTGQPKAYATEFAGRHNKGGNILFAAGHVLTLHARDVLDLDPNSPRRGGGIFPPKAVVWRHDPTLVP